MYNDGFVFSKNYHIYGYKDKVIKPNESIELYKYMVNSNDNINKLLRHDEGHIIKHYLK